MENTYDNKDRRVQFIDCSRCLENLPKDKSPAEYANTQMGFTEKGFQIWCNRHNLDVANYDLLGQKITLATTTE